MPENKDLFHSFADGARKLAGTVTESLSGGGVVRTVYEDGLSRTKHYAEIARINAEIRREKDELQRVFLEIGHLCYEQTQDSPTGFFIPLFEQVKEISSLLAEKEAEINALREEIRESLHEPAEPDPET